jgi:hypothetical protein
MTGVLLHKVALEAAIRDTMVGAQAAIAWLLTSQHSLDHMHGNTRLVFTNLFLPALRPRHATKPNMVSVSCRVPRSRGPEHPHRHSPLPSIGRVASHFHLLEEPLSAMCPQIFLTTLDSSYPLPQKQHWHNIQPPSDLWSNVISALCGQ